jgi:predicted  nucleic acid-binding Zn-ribbon protein
MANPRSRRQRRLRRHLQCTECGYALDVGSTTHLPPCPSCGNAEWDTKSGGDSVHDPYPDRN